MTVCPGIVGASGGGGDQILAVLAAYSGASVPAIALGADIEAALTTYGGATVRSPTVAEPAADTIGANLTQYSGATILAPRVDGMIAVNATAYSGATFNAPSVEGVLQPALTTYSGATVSAPQANADVEPAMTTYSGATVSSPTVSAAAADVAELDAWTRVSTTTTSPGSKTVSSGSNRALFYAISARQPSGSVTAVTYGGQSMTQVRTAFTTGPGADMNASLWVINETGIAAASGTSFAITGGAGSQYRAFAASYENAEQTTLPKASALDEDTSSAAPDTAALATDDGGYAFGFVANASNSSSDVTWSNVTEDIEESASQSYQSIASSTTDGTNIDPSVSVTAFTNSVLITCSIGKA